MLKLVLVSEEARPGDKVRVRHSTGRRANLTPDGGRGENAILDGVLHRAEASVPGLWTMSGRPGAGFRHSRQARGAPGRGVYLARASRILASAVPYTWSGRTTMATRLSASVMRSYSSQSRLRRLVVALKM